MRRIDVYFPHMRRENQSTQNNVQELPKEGAHSTPARLKVLVLIFCGVWTASLFLPSSTDSGDGNGLLVLMMGWAGPLVGVFSWYANPIWLVSLSYFLKENYKKAAQFSSIALVLASQYFLMYILNIKTSFIDSSRVVEPGSGYWVWVLAFVGTLIFSLAEMLSIEKTLPTNVRVEKNEF